MLPTARFLNASLPPQSGGAVEIKKATTAAARSLLENKVTVEEHRLHARQQRIAAIQMPPARLDHADFRIGEEMNRPLKQISWRNEVSVQDANELTGGRFESDCERAGFESGAIDPMNQLHIKTARAQFVRTSGGDVAGIVRGIVEDLNLQ